MNRTKIEYLDFTWNPIAGCIDIGCAVRKEGDFSLKLFTTCTVRPSLLSSITIICARIDVKTKPYIRFCLQKNVEVGANCLI